MTLLPLLGAALAVAPPDEFAAAMSADIRAAHPQCELTPTGPMSARLSCPADEREFALQFDRLYRSCAQDPGACEAERQGYLAALAQTFAPAPPVELRAVLPVVRSARYAEQIPPESAADVLIEPLIGDMTLVWMVDRGDAVRSLTPEDLAALGLQRGQLREAAAANLQRELSGISETSRGRIHTLQAGFYTSSLLLVPQFWEQASAGGPLWAVAPGHDQILYTTSDRAKDQAALRRAAARVAAGHPHPVSLTVLEWRDGRWILAEE